jgi:hypothetical protein
MQPRSALVNSARAAIEARRSDITREEVMEKKKCPVLVVDRPCGLELFHVSTEEPTSEGPPLELWECARGHRTFLSKKEESKSNTRDTGAE